MYPFLADGGEMGQLTRDHDWSETPLGPPDQWPLSLKTTVGILLHSAFPMFLFWGDDLLCFYNDAYRPSLGDEGKHPALGKPARTVWPEIWEFIAPLIAQVRATGEPVWFEDQLLPIHRNGRLEDVYWTFSYSPAYDDAGQIGGVFVTCTETTSSVLSQRRLKESQQQVLTSFEQSPVGVALISRENLVFRMANSFYGELAGRKPEQLVGKSLLEALPELEGQGFDRLLNQVIDTGIPYVATEAPVHVVRRGQLETIYIHFTYQPQRDTDGSTSGILVVCTDVTQQVLARQRVEESEARFRALIQEAPVATCLFVGRDMVIEVANEAMIAVWGKGPSAIGLPLTEALPELVGQPFLTILDTVFTTGLTHEEKAARAELEVNGVLGTYYFDYVYKPLRNTAGEVYGIMDMAVDVTAEVLVRKALQASEEFSRTLFASSPVANLALVGEQMIIQAINASMLEMLGRGADIVGQPFMTAMPELLATPLMERLRHVLATGDVYYQPEERIELIRFGQPYTGYYNYIYSPLASPDGAKSGVIVTAFEVTQQVLARQKVEEAESTLRGAIELAELGTWEVDLATGLLRYSARLREWFNIGPDELITIEKAYSVMREVDRPLVKASMLRAIADGTDGIYDVEYRVLDPDAAQERILRAQGKAHLNQQGKAYKVSGTVQDVTQQRLTQFALEQQVQQRTQQLQASIQDLERSNRNLQQFAYIASHDLQEPLRKIQSFGDLLRNQYAAQLGDGAAHLQRIQTAAARMSTLIKDLLSYSRIATQQDTTATVPLTEVMHMLLTDLDLRIQESDAVIDVGSLPTVQGDKSQLGQLFQNLVSNALKFLRIDAAGKLVAPHIQISARDVTASDLPPFVKPVRTAAVYHQIDVADNGIGFEQRYAERIFEVFQRLHGRNQYAGTGIGLAICEKVVANHGGAITATGKPGQGATFSVYLPV